MRRRKEEEKEADEMVVRFGEEFYHSGQGKKLYVITQLMEEHNTCAASLVTKVGGNIALGDGGTVTMDKIRKKTGKVWSLEEIVQGISNFYGKQIAQDFVEILAESFQKSSATLYRD